MSRSTSSRPPVVSLRIKVSPALFARISEHRWVARHETNNSAVVELIAAGLAALAKPPAIPQPPQPAGPRKLVSYAGADDGERSNGRHAR